MYAQLCVQLDDISLIGEKMTHTYKQEPLEENETMLLRKDSKVKKMDEYIRKNWNLIDKETQEMLIICGFEK